MIVGLKEVLAEGKARGIAIGAFNTPNFECLTAVLEAAEALDVPVIVAHVQLHEAVAPLAYIGPTMLALAERSRVKVCVHLDHGEDIEYLKRAIDMGFSSVMIDCSTLPYEENAAYTRTVVDYAHAHGVDVEAELGALPQREGGTGSVAADPTALYTKPALAADFVARTGVDALAIAFGTAHGIYKTAPILNMDIISAVRERVDVPLVMHGGSGISDAEYREVIRRGIGKINYFSYMSAAGYAAAKRVVASGEGTFFHDLTRAAKDAMKENAMRTLRVFSGLD